MFSESSEEKFNYNSVERREKIISLSAGLSPHISNPLE